jgi:hypothetical protein
MILETASALPLVDNTRGSGWTLALRFLTFFAWS